MASEVVVLQDITTNDYRIVTQEIKVDGGSIYQTIVIDVFSHVKSGTASIEMVFVPTKQLEGDIL